MIRLRAAGKSDLGRVRDKDEDAFLVREDIGLFAVADGVGGHRAGEVASRIAVEALASTLGQALARPAEAFDTVAALSEAFRVAHEGIRQHAESHPRCRGMGTTLVTLLSRSTAAWLAHVGDSRAYLLRRGKFSRLTEDHSAATELARRTPEFDLAALKSSPLAHVLTRCLGMNGSAGADIRPITLESQDRLLLCCDGLTDMLSEERIAQILASVTLRDTCCQSLIDAANEAGGKDNITVVVADVATSA